MIHIPNMNQDFMDAGMFFHFLIQVSALPLTLKMDYLC